MMVVVSIRWTLGVRWRDVPLEINVSFDCTHGLRPGIAATHEYSSSRPMGGRCNPRPEVVRVHNDGIATIRHELSGVTVELKSHFDHMNCRLTTRKRIRYVPGFGFETVWQLVMEK